MDNEFVGVESVLFSTANKAEIQGLVHFFCFQVDWKGGGKENGMVTGLGDLYLFIIGHEDCCLSLCSNCELKSSHGRQEWKC